MNMQHLQTRRPKWGPITSGDSYLLPTSIFNDGSDDAVVVYGVLNHNKNIPLLL